MKRIVCFGDSNTWGCDPVKESRYTPEIRWTGKLQQLLGEEYLIIEEGQNGRTVMSDDPWEGEKNGYQYIIPCIESHTPLDMLIIMLGTNDMKQKFSVSAYEIALSMERMLEKIRSFEQYHMEQKLDILLVSPIHIGENMQQCILSEFFGGRETIEKSKHLGKYYEEAAKKYHCAYLDAATVAEPSTTDGVHMTATGHEDLAKALFPYIIS
ncbi:MAG: SGNH/GDSL hydrolase family protein [Lachnospiraceae bacterium]